MCAVLSAVLVGCSSSDNGKVSPETFQKWTEARAMCLNYPFETHEMESDFSRQLRSLGLKTTIRKTKNTVDGMIEPSVKTPVRIYDARLQQISLQQGAFFARIESTPQAILEIVRRRGLNQYVPLKPINDKYMVAAFLTSKPTKNMPFGQEALVIVVRTTDQVGVIEVGCQRMAN